jgi:hypothetical protein
MTVGKLHRLLSELIEAGHTRKVVVINKDTFTHPLEADGCCMLPVERMELEAYTILDDDGFTKSNKDGTERMTCSLVLKGIKGKEDPLE